MKANVLLYAALSAAALSLTACKIESGGYYGGSGIYDDVHDYDHWQSGRHDSWDDRQSDWNDDRLERKEREAYENQVPNDTSDLHPPGVKPRDGFRIMSLQSAPKSGFQSTDSRVIKVAGKYDISHYAATYIVRAVELAKANDESGIKDLGLETTDFKKVLKGKDLSSAKLAALGSKLLMPSERVEQLLFDIKNDIEIVHSR